MSKGIELLRKQFEPRHISKLPKPTRQQTDAVKRDFKVGIRCEVCGGWHHPKVIHLDYVGHAALTDRLLDVDPGWSWEPMALTDAGLPLFDAQGGLWIKLTVLGITRLGYGAADGKTGGDAVKEIIGDALRNAAMRFGAALDLWHKGDLHAEDDIPMPQDMPNGKPQSKGRLIDGTATTGAPDDPYEDDDLPAGMTGDEPEMVSPKQKGFITGKAIEVFDDKTYKSGIASVCRALSKRYGVTYNALELTKKQASVVLDELKLMAGEDPNE